MIKWQGIKSNLGQQISRMLDENEFKVLHVLYLILVTRGVKGQKMNFGIFPCHRYPSVWGGGFNMLTNNGDMT